MDDFVLYFVVVFVADEEVDEELLLLFYYYFPDFLLELGRELLEEFVVEGLVVVVVELDFHALVHKIDVGDFHLIYCFRFIIINYKCNDLVFKLHLLRCCIYLFLFVFKNNV